MITQSTLVAPDASSVAIKVSNQRRWTIVWLLFAASLINYFDRQTLSFAMPFVANEFNLDPAQQGVVLSSFFWTYTVLQIPIGLCADRFNLRWLYAGAFALWSLVQGFTGFAGSVGMLIACRLLLGIGESIYLVGGSKVVSLLFPLSQRGLPCGLFDAGTRTGLVLEGLIIGGLLTTLGWRTTFMLVGFAALVWLLPWFLATPKQMRDASPGVERTRFVWSEFFTLLRSRDLLGVLLGFFCFDYFWYYLQHRGQHCRYSRAVDYRFCNQTKRRFLHICVRPGGGDAGGQHTLLLVHGRAAAAAPGAGDLKFHI